MPYLKNGQPLQNLSFLQKKKISHLLLAAAALGKPILIWTKKACILCQQTLCFAQNVMVLKQTHFFPLSLKHGRPEMPKTATKQNSTKILIMLSAAKETPDTYFHL